MVIDALFTQGRRLRRHAPELAPLLLLPPLALVARPMLPPLSLAGGVATEARAFKLQLDSCVQQHLLR
jgi:hypothetical protein